MQSLEGIVDFKPFECLALWNMHGHARYGPVMDLVLAHSASMFEAEVEMPNVEVEPGVDSIYTVRQAALYQREFHKRLGNGSHFRPIYTAKLRETTTPGEIDELADAGVAAMKAYPPAITNSKTGITWAFLVSSEFAPVLKAMARRGMKLLVHWECAGYPEGQEHAQENDCHIFMGILVEAHPELRIVFEHVSTKESVSFVGDLARRGYKVAMTCTPHHATLYDCGGKDQPHLYCRPPIKTRADQEAVLGAVASGERWVMLGLDNAPHPAKQYKNPKTRVDLKPGVYNTLTGPAKIIETLVEHKLFNVRRYQQFASTNGPRFYGLKHSGRRVMFTPRAWRVENSYAIPGMDDVIVDCWAGQTMQVAMMIA